MRVEFSTRSGVLGEVALVGGRAEPSNDAARATVEETVIVEPGTGQKLAPEAGERYLRALPANLSGSYFWAVLKDD